MTTTATQITEIELNDSIARITAAMDDLELINELNELSMESGLLTRAGSFYQIRVWDGQSREDALKQTLKRVEYETKNDYFTQICA